MKPIRNPFTAASIRNSLLATTITLILILPQADAQTRFWDSNGATAGAGVSPSGTWGVDSFWSTSNVGTASTANSTTTLNDDLFFSAGTDAVDPYTVTVVDGKSAKNLFIQEGSPTFSGGTISLGFSGGITVDTTAVSAVVSSNLVIGGNQIVNIADGRTLALNRGSLTRSGGILNVRSTGTVTSTMTNLATNNAAGIIGAWVTFNTGAATQFATFSGSTITGFTGTAAATGADLTDTTGLINYELALADGTMPASVSASTIRYTGVAGTTTPGSSFRINGLLNVGTGQWSIGAGTMTIGVDQELVVNSATANISIASDIVDSDGGVSALTKTGSGALFLSGNNSFSGNIDVNSGILDVGMISGGSLASGGLHLMGGAILQGSGTFDRPFSNNRTPTAGQVTGANGGFAARGGQLTVNFGGSGETISMSGTAFSNRLGDNVVFGSPSADSPVVVENPLNLNGSNRIFTVNSGVGGDSAELAGVISQSTGTWGITKNGAGLLILSAANTYAGRTTINNGVLDVGTLDGVDDSLGGGSLLLTNNSILQANGSFTRAFSGNANPGVGQVAGATGGFAAKGGTLTLDFGGAGGSLVLSGAAFSNRLGDNFVFGSATADSPVILLNPIDLNGANRTFTVNPGVGGDSAELSGVISHGTGNYGLIKGGGGLLIVSGENTFTGNVTINNGTIQISRVNSLGTTAGSTTITSGGSSRLALSGDITIAENITIGARNSLDQLQNVSGINTLTGNLTWSSGGTAYGVNSTAGKLTLNGPVSPLLGSKTLNVSGSGDVEFTGNIGNPENVGTTLSIVKSGTGTLTLSGGGNTYSGNTTIAGGTMVFTSASTFGDNSTVTINGGTLQLNQAGTDRVGVLIINNIQQEDGLYTFGTGQLEVGGQTAYEAWALSEGLDGTPGKENGPSDDPDNDNSSNLAEFATNGNPLSGSDNGMIHSFAEDSLVLTIAVREGAPAFVGSPSPSATVDGITYRIQGGTDLATFTTQVTPIAPVTTDLPGAGTGYEYRSFSLVGSSGLPGKGFLRLEVTQP